MSSGNIRSIIKAAYLLQLRHGPFTEVEFEAAGNASELQNVLKLQYLEEQQVNQEKRYSLSEKGRAQIKVVLAGGVYDVLHLGHLAALTEAKTLGDVLVAVVATDITVEMLKGRKPVFPQEDRRALVEGLKPVDKAILGYEDVGFGFEQVLVEVMPDIVAFGYDQENLERSVSEIINRRKLKIQTVKLTQYEHERYLSSTSVKQKLSEQLR
ncbi:MAG: adenylyltransferase/cytidyltransferase family protein [Candidatus Bathyarchaeia archaeon]|jgi:cytidyltransferase-like protein